MNRLSESRKEEIITRLFTGEVVLGLGHKSYKIVSPSQYIRRNAQEIYNKTLHENRFGEWITDADALKILTYHSLCTKEIDDNIKAMDKQIEDLKVTLYESLFLPNRFDESKKMLDMVKNKYSQMYALRHSLDYLTLRGYAEMVRRQYIVFMTLYNYDTNKKIWDAWEDIDTRLLENIVSELASNSISIEDLREVARTDPWKNYWYISNCSPFRQPLEELTDEQKTVCIFSHMYDNALKHPESPTDDVMNDDDLFDGWLIKKRREREKEQMNQHVDKQLGGRKHADAHEVFIMAKDVDAAKKIEAMNDIQAKMVKKQRGAILQKKGTAVDNDFMDVKLDLQRQSNEKFKETVGRK